MRVAIAEDSVLLREGIARLLTDAGFDVVARCGDAEQLRAVEKYVSSIFGKLGLPATGSESRRVLAVLLFLRT